MNILLQQASGGFISTCTGYIILSQKSKIQCVHVIIHYSAQKSLYIILIIEYKCRNGMWMHNTKTCYYCMRAGTVHASKIHAMECNCALLKNRWSIDVLDIQEYYKSFRMQTSDNVKNLPFMKIPFVYFFPNCTILTLKPSLETKQQ